MQVKSDVSVGQVISSCGFILKVRTGSGPSSSGVNRSFCETFNKIQTKRWSFAVIHPSETIVFILSTSEISL